MRAVIMDSFGGPEVLRWAVAPDPVPQPGDVLIEVAHAGVNHADMSQRKGNYPPPPGASDILGLECAGRILTGEAAGLGPGDEVCALLAGGGYAEQVAVPAAQVLPIPAGVTLAEAAGLPEVVCTVWSNLAMTAGLSAGETVLVHGGSSGIGTMAIQIARLIGARPIVTASTPEKMQAALDMGADVAINYRNEDFVTRVQEETDGRGVDVILDVVGAKYLQRNISALGAGGRLVVIGMIGGTTAELNLTALMPKRAGVFATTLRGRPKAGPGSKAEVVQQVREHVWPAIEAGQIRPVIGQRLPIDEVAEAHRRLGDGEVIGKMVLDLPQAAEREAEGA